MIPSEWDDTPIADAARRAARIQNPERLTLNRPSMTRILGVESEGWCRQDHLNGEPGVGGHCTG